MLAANPYWETLEFYWLNVLSPFGMEDVNIFIIYYNLFLDTVFPTHLPNFKSELLPVSQSIPIKQTNKQSYKNLCDLI